MNGVPSNIEKGSFRAWILAARLQTLLVGVVPVVVGTAVAHASGGVVWSAAFAALFGSVMIQLRNNFGNDLFDFQKGVDNAERVGPPRAAQLGLLTTKQLAVGMAVCFGLATLAGVYLTSLAGWPIVLIGVLSIVSGIAYTGGPYPLGYNGLGDVFVFVFFGFVAVGGTALVQVGHWPGLAILAAIPVGALATAVLVVNNTRDCETDLRSGKRTLVARYGRLFGIGEYAVLLLAAYGAVALLPLLFSVSWVALLPWLTLPMSLRLMAAMMENQGAALNPYLGATARLLALFGLLLAVGIAW